MDVTETGSSLRANDLRVIDTVLESTPRFISNPAAYADDWKRLKMERLLMMLNGAIAAVGRVGLMLNVAEVSLPEILNILPALTKPTVSHLANGEEPWVAINTIVEERLVTELVPKLSEAGARGIVEYPLNKIIE